MYKYENYEDFRSELHRDQVARRAFRSDYFDIVETEILNEEKELDIFIENKAHNIDDLNALIEHREILRKLTMLTHLNDYNNNNNLNNNLNTINLSKNYDINKRDNMNSFLAEGRGGLQFISGVILAENELKLRRTVFRVSYGLGLTTFWDMNIENSLLENIRDKTIITSTSQPKKIFTIFLKSSDSENNYLFSKLIKICDTLGASRYNIPPAHSLGNILNEIDIEIKKMEIVLEEQLNSIRTLILSKIGNRILPGKYSLFRLFFKKQKEIFLNLSKCNSSRSFYNGEIWVLEKHFSEIQQAIDSLSNRSSNHHGTNIENIINAPKAASPTYIDSNEFIWPFQEIVDTYGIPRFEEINPTVFNIITFPFLFGVMFGDIGHGLILLIFAIYLCWSAENIKNNKNSLFKSVISARYLLLLMGFFAFYCGWIYNEFFSVALPVFGGSCYTNKLNVNNTLYYDRKDRDCIYIFGMDPKWQVAKNELSFNNSFKMKLSVILGVFHMLFGIVLKGFNCLHFKDYLGLSFEFIPQLIFMLMLFGYMDFMIFVKWIRNWDGKTADAPSLISQLMNIFLKFGSVVGYFFLFYF